MRIHKYLILYSIVLAFLLWTPHTLFADISTLERIAEAERKVSYVGLRLKTFSSSRGTRTFEEVVIHKSVDASYRKVVSIVGERQSSEGSRNRNERRDNNRHRNDNGNRRDRQETNWDRHEWRQVRSQFSKEEIELIAQNYNLEESASTEKIVSYETNILTITPKFAGRPTKRIFFARENGVILRVEDLDAEGVLQDMFVYTRISFNPEAVERKWKAFEKEIKPRPPRSSSISLAEAEKMIKTKPIQPEYLPPGFQLKDVRIIKSRENDSILLEYTDGLVNFTLFEKTGKPPRIRDRDRREETEVELEGITVYKRLFRGTDTFRWSGAKIHFFLIGAVPASEMQKVVESIIQKTKEK
ncbi:hypothetical protein C6500_21165 [Candidatus Poribacteria bacterium]|nr:MAG: hypothetical protein C6500_21165 [Candidatus Poribacteria bacterium]